MAGKYWRTLPSGKRVRTKAGIAREYKLYQSSPKQIAERDARNSARRSAMKKGLVHKNDGLDVHHSQGINSKNGLKVLSAHTNRGIHEKSRLKGSIRKKRGSRA